MGDGERGGDWTKAELASRHPVPGLEAQDGEVGVFLRGHCREELLHSLSSDQKQLESDLGCVQSGGPRWVGGGAPLLLSLDRGLQLRLRSLG